MKKSKFIDYSTITDLPQHEQEAIKRAIEGIAKAENGRYFPQLTALFEQIATQLEDPKQTDTETVLLLGRELHTITSGLLRALSHYPEDITNLFFKGASHRQFTKDCQGLRLTTYSTILSVSA
ncbi:hypothetical protein A4G19_13545 [Pasteurellaceae bacterium Macca]|nr:hypothetical protein [Pasteurellaceae bacterium Macca]